MFKRKFKRSLYIETFIISLRDDGKMARMIEVRSDMSPSGDEDEKVPLRHLIRYNR